MSPTRQELYDRIRQSSRDEVILEEMIRLGFWPREGERAADPADEIRRQGELRRELRDLRARYAKLADVNRLRKELRKKRLEESRRKQRETKERRLQERKEKAARWQQAKEQDIVFLGPQVSAGLGKKESDAARLGAMNLPVLHSVSDLAAAAGLDLRHLRFLAFDRQVSSTTHYVRFAVPKKSGGQRLISAPMPRLKWLQSWVLYTILDKVPCHPAAHGFRYERSILTNARSHLGAQIVLNVDLEDFFPTLTYRRVKGMFCHLGYSEQVATVLALVSTEADTAQVELDGRTYYVRQGERFLPQGAPSSPAITNLICRRLDARLTGLAKSLGLTYTRYADDLTFSKGDSSGVEVGRCLAAVRHIARDEGFNVNGKKTRVLRRGQRLEVTGLVVNNGSVTVPRALLRRFRALLFHIERDGPAGKRWGTSGNVLASIRGFANFVYMVDQERGRAMLERVAGIVERYGAATPKPRERAVKRWRSEHHERRSRAFPPRPEPEPETPATREAPAPAPSPSPRRGPWWKFWT